MTRPRISLDRALCQDATGYDAMRAGQIGAVEVFSSRLFPAIIVRRAAHRVRPGKRFFRLVSVRQLNRTMCNRLSRLAGGLSLAAWLLSSSLALAQGNEPKPPEKPPAAGQEQAKEPQKVDEFAEAQRAVSGPAGNPECVWLGRRVVNLLWRDDLDTAFRHLDLYDRFGCPSAHIQASFRCLILHGNNIDPKAADSLNGRIHACWINPAAPAMPPPPPAAANPPPKG